jgi:hypothetical protein
MFHQSSKKILLGILVALLLLTMPVYAVKNLKISNYGGAHQIWFEAEDYDERNPDTDQFYPVVDADGAFGQAITRAGGTGGMIRWTFDISTANGRDGTWYFWARQINPSNASDYMLVEGDPGDAEIPTGPPFPGGSGEAPFANEDDRIFEENVGPPWGWARAGHEEGHTKKLQDGDNTMYIFHRQGNNTVFWDVFMWTDSPHYVPTDEHYRNAEIFVLSTASNPSPANGAIIRDTWASLYWSPGGFAASHDVYFGENFDDVNAGTGGTFRGNQTSNHFLVGLPGYPYPDGLVPDTTYYWRIDEVETDGVTKHKGRIWSLFVPPGITDPSSVSTFHCIGVYWSPRGGGSDNVCQVHYRSYGSTGWKEALSLWYDDRGVGGYRAGYRGSIVNLNPGTVYEIKLELLNTGTKEEFIAETWSEDFPIAKTVYLPAGTTNQAFEITESGSPDGYILYTHPEGESSTINVNNQEDSCIYVSASYIIIRGLTLREASVHGIRILNNVHDVVIEECDISGWGRLQEGEWGHNNDAAVYSDSPNIERIIVQRNKLHHPRPDTNSWKESARTIPRNTHHPLGPKAITFKPRNERAGNYVIRYNEIYSDEEHYYNDCMGETKNHSYTGFPIRDSDIYGNYIANCWDDGIEAEGANCNVRIWGNYITRTPIKIATRSVTVGPIYVWRNVFDISRAGPAPEHNYGWTAFKAGNYESWSHGKFYVFHNTILQPPPPDSGSSSGIISGSSNTLGNMFTRNNILHVSNDKNNSISNQNQNSTNDFDYDLYNGRLNVSEGHELNGIYGVPTYIPSSGYDRTTNKGIFELSSYSLGYDASVVIPNFNDNYNGAAPDIGAHEAGSPPMEFGVNAYQ